MPRQKTSVRVAGKAYTLVSEDEPEYMARIAAHVDRSIDEVTQTAHVPLQDAAVLTAINLADELMKSKEEARRLRMQLQAFREAEA